MDSLFAAIVLWLSANLNLPAIQDYPRIERVPSMASVALRLGERALPTVSGREFEALYDDRSRTIYVPQSWTGTTPKEVSVLVHEMVHHVQNVAGLEYDCAEAREKPAYVAQEKWLALTGRNLAEEFDLDLMTVLVRTRCMH